MSVKFEIKGLKEVQDSFNSKISAVNGNLERSINNVALDLLERTIPRVPIESGDLRSSGQVSGSGNQRTVSFSAFSKDGYNYAVRQHEDLTLRHDRTDGHKTSDGRTVNMVAGGEAKFLENTFKENYNRYLKIIENSVKEAVK